MARSTDGLSDLVGTLADTGARISAIVVAQVAAPAMRAAGSGTILVTGGGFADHPIPAPATVSLGKAALRSAATILALTWNRTASVWPH